MISFDRFTLLAKDVLRESHVEAVKRQCVQIDTDLVVVALLSQSKSVAVRMLNEIDVQWAMTRIAVESKMRGVALDKRRTGGVAPAVMRVLEDACAEARDLHHPSVTTGHILIGLLRQDEGHAVQELKIRGADLEKLRTAMDFVLGKQGVEGQCNER